MVLASDFYRPPTLAAIFSALFPQESYFPNSSPVRVHQLIFRTRELLNQHQLSEIIQIQESRSRYILKIADGYCLELHKNQLRDEQSKYKEKSAVQVELLVKKIIELDPENLGMKAPLLAIKLKKPIRTIQYLVKAGVTAGVLRYSGNARSTLIFRT